MQSLKPTQVESSDSGRFSDGGSLMFFYFASLNAAIRINRVVKKGYLP
jgi:hypothetical protein